MFDCVHGVVSSCKGFVVDKVLVNKVHSNKTRYFLFKRIYKNVCIKYILAFCFIKSAIFVNGDTQAQLVFYDAAIIHLTKIQMYVQCYMTR